MKINKDKVWEMLFHKPFKRFYPVFVYPTFLSSDVNIIDQ